MINTWGAMTACLEIITGINPRAQVILNLQLNFQGGSATVREKP